MEILCDECVHSTPHYCNKSRMTFPKAIACTDFRVIHWKSKLPALVKPIVEKEFFTYTEGAKKECIAYAYLP